jgi:hypothetical protein
MGKLSNRRHEIFATELASGAPLLTSYLRAGYKESYSARFNASRLKNTAKVSERIDELLAEFSRTTFVKLEWIQHQLVNIIEGKDPSCLTTGEKGEFVERNRLAALTALAKTITGTQLQVKHEHDISDELAAIFASLSVADQRVFREALRALADERRNLDAAPGSEGAPAQRAAPGDRNPPPRSAAPLTNATPQEPAAPPAAERPRPGRARFLQLAKLRADAARPLNPEFCALRSDIQGQLVRFVSPVMKEPDISTWPASPTEIREALGRLTPAEINELLNLMAAKSDTLRAFDRAL